MGLTLGKGFGPFDFDGNGRLNSVGEEQPETDGHSSPDGGFMRQFLIDEELARALNDAGIDLMAFIMSEDEDRRQMLEDAGLDPDDFEWDEDWPDDDDDDDDLGDIMI